MAASGRGNLKHMRRNALFAAVSLTAVLAAGAASAQSISVGQTVRGTIAASDPALDDGSHYDCWVFNAPAGVYILVNGVPGVTPKPAVKAALLPTLGRLKAITFDQIEQDSIFAAHFAAQQRYGTRAVTYTASALGHGCPPAADDTIFDPGFMACLIRRGEAVWAQGSPWKAYPKP